MLECRLMQSIELGLHTQFIGEILDVKADESVLGPDGLPDITVAKPVVFSPEPAGYFGIGEFLGRAFSVGRRP